MAQLERLELVTRKVFRGRMKGERRSKRKGQSVEFADFRQYVPGDDLRSLDWNLYARLDKLIIKLFLEEEDLHFFTLIDASLSMDFGNADEVAICQAAGGGAWVCRADSHGSGADRDAWAKRCESAARCCAGGESVWRMLEYLDGIEAGETISLAQGVKNFCVAQFGQRDRRSDFRPDGQEWLRVGAAVS